MFCIRNIISHVIYIAIKDLHILYGEILISDLEESFEKLVALQIGINTLGL